MVKPIDKLPTDDPGCVTFVFHHEDHTLGNLLRSVLVTNRKVDFAGYTIPHPSEPILHLRIQCQVGYKAEDMLKEAFVTIREMCGVVEGSFEEALSQYQLQQM